MNLRTTKRLNNGVEIPIFGLGVYKSGAETQAAVAAALRAGYRHIDTAALYHNEELVGRAIRESGIPREEIFVTTKLWNDDMTNGTQREAFNKSLELLGMDYVDMYLIHWPVSGAYKESWRIMEELYERGKIRAIGLSNFHMNHLMDLMSGARVVPVMNQVECHPYLNQKPLRTFCNNLGIEVTAWSPLGRANVLQDAVIIEIAEKHRKTPAQVVLRWEIQEGIITIPKSIHEARIIENADVFNFKLTPDDIYRINSLNRNQRFGTNPDTFETKQW